MTRVEPGDLGDATPAHTLCSKGPAGRSKVGLAPNSTRASQVAASCLHRCDLSPGKAAATASVLLGPWLLRMTFVVLIFFFFKQEIRCQPVVGKDLRRGKGEQATFPDKGAGRARSEMASFHFM